MLKIRIIYSVHHLVYSAKFIEFCNYDRFAMMQESMCVPRNQYHIGSGKSFLPYGTVRPAVAATLRAVLERPTPENSRSMIAENLRVS